MKTKNKKNYIVVIPARYDSTRLPGKLLIKLRGKTVLQNVWEKCVKSVGFNNVIPYTDNALHEKIYILLPSYIFKNKSLSRL